MVYDILNTPIQELFENPDTQQVIKNVARISKALDNEQRLALLSYLTENPGQTISQLMASFSLKRESVVQHLSLLQKIGVLLVIKKDLINTYHVNTSGLENTLKKIVELSEAAKPL